MSLLKSRQIGQLAEWLGMSLQNLRRGFKSLIDLKYCKVAELADAPETSIWRDLSFDGSNPSFTAIKQIMEERWWHPIAAIILVTAVVTFLIRDACNSTIGIILDPSIEEIKRAPDRDGVVINITPPTGDTLVLDSLSYEE